MYIQTYQIHNVLNVYRKQLSQGSASNSDRPATPLQKGDRVELSGLGQRQSIIDQVSAEIVDRIAKTGPRGPSAEASARDAESKVDPLSSRGYKKSAEFTFTAIDENGQKVTNTLPVKNFSPLTGEGIQEAQNSTD